MLREAAIVAGCGGEDTDIDDDGDHSDDDVALDDAVPEQASD